MRIRSGRRTASAVALALALAAPAPGKVAAATDIDALRSRLVALVAELERATLAADAAAQRWMDLRLREMEARAAEQGADRAFADRVRSAYIAGPGRAIELVLGSRDLHELAARLPYAKSALAVERIDAGELAARRAGLERVLGESAGNQRRLVQLEERLASLRARIEAGLAAAESAARSDAEAQAIGAVRAHYEGTVDRVAGATRTIRYRKGEQMFQSAAPFLGPRADCSIPKGLRSTGDVIAGDASWYGNAFRGKPTASGAIFHPERYTVAHRSLPFGLFLLIRLGDRCVVSFLNDRGPYVDGRILDLSHASAQAIGLTGVKGVSATLLVRAT